MSPSDGPVTRYDNAVEKWNDAKTDERQALRAECRSIGHAWHRLPGTGGVTVCLRCISYHEPETAEGWRAA